MVLTVGEPGPWFSAPTPSNPKFDFDTMAGRYVLLAFLPVEAEGRTPMLQAVAANRNMFDDVKLSAFVVVPGDGEAVQAQDMRGLRWFSDTDGEIAKLYQINDVNPPLRWILLDPNLRVIAWASATHSQPMFRTLAGLPPVDLHSGAPITPPVLILPRVFEPEFCKQLIELYDSGPGGLSGVMQDIDGKTVEVMDRHKSRRDITVRDPELIEGLKSRLENRLFPEVFKCFQFQPSRIERYIVSCYDAADGAVFHPHRDNTTIGTAYRRFACSINLNADFEGGDLRFPEYSRETFRPPPGGAVIFSCSLIHEVTPVTAGRRYAFLPFIHDEAAHVVLEAYRNSLKQEPA